MSTINNGNQVLTFDYKQGGTSQGFNRLFHKVLPEGILSGGDLTRVTDTSVTLSPMVAMFSDNGSNVTVRIETTEEATIGVSTSAPYVIAKFKWINVEENFVEFTASEYSSSLENDGLIIGKCLFKSNQLTGFDYTRKSWSQDHFWNKNHLDFRVVPNEPEDNTIKVEKGKAIIGGKVVEFEGGTKTINTNISLQRIDLVSINSDGQIVITEGVQSESPKVPVFPNDMLTVATIKMGSNPQQIKGDMITNFYNSNFIQSSSNLKVSKIISSTSTVDLVEGDTKYIIEGVETSLTLGGATPDNKGCIVQVYSAIDNAKLNVKNPNKIYKLTKGEYIHLVWNGVDWVDTIQTTTWDLRNTPYSVPLSADLNDYTKAGTWKNEKMIGIKHIPTLVTQTEESSSDGKSYCTLIVEEGDGWIKQYIKFTNTTTAQGNGSGHYEVTRGGLISPEGQVQWQEEWSCKADEANRDSAGNVITTTYATKLELSKEVEKIEEGTTIVGKVAMTWFINTAYPKGSYYWTSEASFNPNVDWGVGTWVQVKDKMIMAKGSTFTSNGGNSNGTITLSEGQLPSHSHGMEHTHTKGTMKITGNLLGLRYDVFPASRYSQTGALYITRDGNSIGGIATSTSSYAETIRLDTSYNSGSGWTGETSPSRQNTDSVGLNQLINIMPPYIVAYCWQRTA